jgi:hypothetical protein
MTTQTDSPRLVPGGHRRWPQPLKAAVAPERVEEDGTTGRAALEGEGQG